MRCSAPRQIPPLGRKRRGEFIRTFRGAEFWPLDPLPEEIHILDVAHALSNLCRFGGHCRQFYSVAQHSVLVSLSCKPEDAAWGLMHDAAEAYLVDLPRPIKRDSSMRHYRELEERILYAVKDAFGLPTHALPASVVEADNRLLATEMRDLTRCSLAGEAPPFGFRIDETLAPQVAKAAFLDRFRQLFPAFACMTTEPAE